MWASKWLVYTSHAWHIMMHCNGDLRIKAGKTKASQISSLVFTKVVLILYSWGKFVTSIKLLLPNYSR